MDKKLVPIEMYCLSEWHAKHAVSELHLVGIQWNIGVWIVRAGQGPLRKFHKNINFCVGAQPMLGINSFLISFMYLPNNAGLVFFFRNLASHYILFCCKHFSED